MATLDVTMDAPSSTKRRKDAAPPVVKETEAEAEADLKDVELESEPPEIETGEFDQDAEVNPAKPPTRRERKRELLREVSKPKEDTSLTGLARNNDQDLSDWLGALGGSGPIQVRLVRSAPRTFAGKNVKGHLETIDNLDINEDQIAERWGGGSYQLRVMHRNKMGSWVYKASTSIDIAGDPRTDNLPKSEPNADTPEGATARADAGTGRVVDLLERELTASRQSKNTGPDMAMISAMMRPLEIQIQTLTNLTAKKDDQIEKLQARPSNPVQDSFMSKLLDDDNSRVQQIRLAHDTELRTVKENNIQDISRLTDRYDREKDTLVRQYERQLADQKSGYERELANMKSGYERELAAKDNMQAHVKIATDTSATVTKAALENDNRRLERDVAKLELEVKELRALKQKGPLELVKEVEEFKEALGIGDDEGKDKSTLEKVVETVMGSEKLFEFASKWVAPTPSNGNAQQQHAPQQQQQQQQLQRQPRMIRKNGQMLALAPDGKYYPVRRRRGSDGAETEEIEEGLTIPPHQLEFAKRVLEQAFMNGTKPEKVAATISTNLPAEIFDAIRAHGVDGFLNKVAKLEATSPLRRQDGINWLRKLGKALIGDEAAPMADDPPESDGSDVDLEDVLGLT